MGWNDAGRHVKRHGKQVPDARKGGRGANAAGPRKRRAAQPSSAYPDPEQEPENPATAGVRTGIVSVNGQDVGVMHCRHS